MPYRSFMKGLIFAVFLPGLMPALGCARSTPRALKKISLNVPSAFPKTHGAALPQKWWRHFNDPSLNDAMETALQNNPGLRATWARLKKATAAAQKVGAVSYPTLTATGSAGAGYGYSFIHKGGYDVQSFTLSLAASYEVDLWGRKASALRAARFDLRSTGAALYTAALTLSGEVVSAWYSLAQARSLMALLREQERLNDAYLKNLKLRFAQGQGRSADVLQQTQAVEAIKGQIIAAEQESIVARSRLALLLGRVSSQMKIPGPTMLPTLPPLPKTGLPIDLIRRRPDIMSALFDVKAANERVAEAIADRMPRFSLTLGGGTSAAAFKDIFRNWLLNLALNLTAPIFNGGELKAQVALRKAELEEKIALYQESVLKAVSDVEVWIVRERTQRAYLVNLKRQIALSEKYLKDMEFRYLQGTSEFTIYLTSKMAYHNLQITLLTARAALVQIHVGLLRSLAGGWDLTQTAASQKRKGTSHGKE